MRISVPSRLAAPGMDTPLTKGEMVTLFGLSGRSETPGVLTYDGDGLTGFVSGIDEFEAAMARMAAEAGTFLEDNF
ncbi:hypothetical protein EKO27_g1737 [Xylaria grammica]|uniref:Uncharacterized protein n=1 Tax=Xylaria grammica TaxID=363999 RepID=A0A439DG53_9PEZI|nr:hypothetical protein EKO27_g1737 [Xylaria grammica]